MEGDFCCLFSLSKGVVYSKTLPLRATQIQTCANSVASWISATFSITVNRIVVILPKFFQVCSSCLIITQATVIQAIATTREIITETSTSL